MIQNKSKCSLYVGFNGYIGVKVRAKEEVDVTLSLGHRVENFLGISARARFDKDMNFNVVLSRVSKRIRYKNSAHEFMIERKGKEYGVNSMEVYKYRTKFGYSNSYFLEVSKMQPRIGFKQNVKISENFGFSWGMQLHSHTELIPFYGFFYKDVDVTFPIYNLFEIRDPVIQYSIVLGFFAMNILDSIGDFFSTKYYLKKERQEKKEKEFDELYEKKLKIDGILERNQRIINNKAEKFRVFVVNEKYVDDLKYSDSWQEDFDFQETGISTDYLVEISQTFYFYRYILGCLPIEKDTLIGYLEPKKSDKETLKIVVFKKINENVEIYEFDFFDKIIL